MAANLWKYVDSNKRKSIFFISFFVIFVVGLGILFSYAYDSSIILIIAVLIAIVQAFIGFYGGDSIILSISGAKEIKKSDNPLLYRTVENLAITAGLPMPKVYIIDDPAPNAFATGRDPKHASVAATTGLLRVLEKTELEGVIAHELSHIGNYDIRLTMIIAILVSVVALLSDLFLRSRLFGLGRSRDENGGNQTGALIAILAIVAAILAPIVAMVIQLAISRKREFLADADGALLTRYPEGLAGALEKIAKYREPVEHASSATAHLYFANPLKGNKQEESFFGKILSTHPPIQERISLLRDLEIR